MALLTSLGLVANMRDACFFVKPNKVSSFNQQIKESRRENPQKLTQLSSRSHPRHLVGKRTAQKDT